MNEASKPCRSCGSWISDRDTRCPYCHQPTSGPVAAPKAEKQPTPEQLAQREAYEKFKLEVIHVPRWLRRIVNFFTFCNHNRWAHRAVQWACGIAFAGVAFSSSAVLADFFSGWDKTVLGLQITLSLLTFLFIYDFSFLIFRKNVEIMLMVWSDEKEARILRGQMQQQYDDYLKGK